MDRLAQKPKSTAAGDIAFGLTVAAAGLVIAAVSFAHLGNKPHVLAQATQTTPVQTAPADVPKAAPAEPGGTRPTTPSPEPARPDADAQKAGATPALPPAPAEKTGEPIPERK